MVPIKMVMGYDSNVGMPYLDIYANPVAGGQMTTFPEGFNIPGLCGAGCLGLTPFPVQNPFPSPFWHRRERDRHPPLFHVPGDSGDFAVTKLVYYQLPTGGPSAFFNLYGTNSDCTSISGVNMTWQITPGPTTKVGCICCQTVCLPVTLPQKDLQLEITNLLYGNQTVTLSYGGNGTWSTACVNGLMFTLGCLGGKIELRAIYFVTGNCPGGTQQYCSTSA